MAFYLYLNRESLFNCPLLQVASGLTALYFAITFTVLNHFLVLLAAFLARLATIFLYFGLAYLVYYLFILD